VWMGRDDARAVPGLQGGAAPARAFAAYMRVAVAKRPVEQFDTDLKLPEWQLEPDEEHLYGDPSEYYYVDEQGNLVDQNRRNDWRDDPYPPPDQQPADKPAPPAASPDFLERAIGGAMEQRGGDKGPQGGGQQGAPAGRGGRPAPLLKPEDIALPPGPAR